MGNVVSPTIGNCDYQETETRIMTTPTVTEDKPGIMVEGNVNLKMPVLYHPRFSQNLPSVTVTFGVGIEKSSIGLGLGSTDSSGTIVGRLTGIPSETSIVLTFSQHFITRPGVVIVTNAYRELGQHGPYAVEGWDHSSFTIVHNITWSTSASQVIPLFYYMVL